MSPRGLTSEAATDWSDLGHRTTASTGFDPDAVDVLPEPIRRWLVRAVPRGTLLHTGAQLGMRGQIRLGAWRPFTAVQRITPAGGFIWAATARLLGLPVTGFDRYTRGSGQMRWRLLNAIPVMTADGTDVTRSAAGRHAAELLSYSPTAALTEGVSWQPVDDDRATARLQIGPVTAEVTVVISPDGMLTEMVLPRWGNPDGTGFADYTFGASFHAHRVFSGITLPSEITAGWYYGTDRWEEGQFIRYSVDAVDRY